MQSWLKGRNWVGKGAQATGMTASLRILSSKADSNTWESFTVSDGLGRHVFCWCWSTVFSEVHSQHSHLPGHFRALHASFCWQALWRCWFNFPAGLGTCPHCQRYQKLVQWPWCYCAWLASKLAWPEPHLESRWETPDPTMQMTWSPSRI